MKKTSNSAHYDNRAYEEVEDKPRPLVDNKQDGVEPSREDSVPFLFAAIHAGNLDSIQSILDQSAEFLNSSSYGGLTPLHAACHMQQLNVLKLLMAKGAKVNCHDSLGNSVLHVAVREQWHEGIRELLQHGASPNKMSQPPSTVSGVTRETPLHIAVRMGDKTATSLLLKHQPDLNIKDGNNCSIFHLAASKKHISILKELMAEENFSKYLSETEQDGQSIFHAALASDSGVQNESKVLKVFEFVYKLHNNLDQVNVFGETPLVLACRAGFSNIVKFLLNHGADPTRVTREGQSTVHAACIAGCSTSLRLLISTGRVGHLITHVDNEGHHPFYFAIESASVECCKILLDNGEHLSYTNQNGESNCELVLEKLPSAMQLFRDLFDSSVKLSKKQQHDSAFSITFDYSVLMSSEKEKMQCSIVSELPGTPLESLIKHPLIESFLYIKWCRIRSIFYINVIQYFTYILLHTIFVMYTFGPNPKDWSKDPTSLMLFKVFHIILLLILLGPGIVVTIANFKKYVLQWETYNRFIAMLSSAITMSLISGQINDDVVKDSQGEANLTFQRGMASVSVFFGWVELMMLLGRFPTLGAYILMFTKVGKSVIKFLLSFLSLLIGFSLTFHILFQRLPIFDDYKLSFAKTLMMMTGEIAYSEFVAKNGSPFNAYCLILISVFLFMATIIMSNLLIGLAVSDIPDLKRQGKIKRLVKQASYLMGYERLLAFTYQIKFFPRKLRLLFASRLSIKTVVTILPNNEFKLNKYMKTIPDETIKEAITLGSCEKPEDFPTEPDEPINWQLKAFHIRYSSDRRTQRHNISNLSNVCTDIRKQLDQMKETMDSQLSRMSMQFQQQIQQTQNLYNQLMQNQSS